MTNPMGGKHHLWTVAAIGVIAYIVQDFTHELLGHGVAARLFGAHPYVVSAIFLKARPAFPGAPGRWIGAAGSLVNFLEAAVCWLVLRSSRLRSPHWRYFLWFSLVLNLFAEGSYMALCVLFGDWQAVTSGLEPLWLWRGLCVLVGLALDVLAAVLGVRLIEPFLGREPAEREGRARALTLYSYLAGSTVCLAAVMLLPDRLKLVGMALGAFYGGSSLFAYLPSLVRKPGPQTPEEPLWIDRSYIWLTAAVIASAAFIGIVGPGLPLDW